MTWVEAMPKWRRRGKREVSRRLWGMRVAPLEMSLEPCLRVPLGTWKFRLVAAVLLLDIHSVGCSRRIGKEWATFSRGSGPLRWGLDGIDDLALV